MTEKDWDVEKRNADEAKRLIDNPQISDAFQALEDNYLEGLLLCDPKDDLGRFRFKVAIETARLVRRHLEVMVESGKLAQHEMDQLGSRKRFF